MLTTRLVAVNGAGSAALTLWASAARFVRL
jgi:hypothetical protein